MRAGEEEADAKQKFRVWQIAMVGGGGNLVRSLETRRCRKVWPIKKETAS
jgi:hypothetical protein